MALQLERRAQRRARMHGVMFRRAEFRHHGIADKFIDAAAFRQHGVGSAFEIVVKQLHRSLGAEDFTDLGEITDVREQHGDGC